MRVVSMSSVRSWRAKGAGLTGSGCVGEVTSPGTSLAGYLLLFDREEWLAGHAIEEVDPALLGGLRDCIDCSCHRV